MLHQGRFLVDLVMGALAGVLDVGIRRAAAIRDVPCLGAPAAPARGPFQDLGALKFGNDATDIAQEPRFRRFRTIRHG